MINPKNICVSACIGFFLSFFIGLLSDVRFSHVLIRAFSFALVFAALCIGVTFLYQKFLSNDNGGFSAEAETVSQKTTSGGVVNIVVDDSNLSDDGLAPKFTIMSKHVGDLAKSDEAVKKEGPVKAQSKSPESISAAPSPQEAPAVQPSAAVDNDSGQNDSSFKPVSLADTQAQSKQEPAPASAPAADSNSIEQLDELPDISSMSESPSDSSSDSVLDSVNEVVSDSEFASGGAPLKEQPVSGDTNVMAKAIQTLLAQDN